MKESEKKIAFGIVALVVVASISAYWAFFNQSKGPVSVSTASTFSPSAPLNASEFSFNYTKCRQGDVIYINFYVTNKPNETVHYVNSSVTYDTILFSNGTLVTSNQVHSSEKATQGPLGTWHIGIPVAGLWPNGVTVSSAQITFTVFILELHRNLSWTVTIPVLETDPTCHKS